MSLASLQRRFNDWMQEYSEDIVKDSISEVGIKRRTGNLLDSIKYVGEVEQGVFRIVVEANYADYLNRGYAPFVLWNGGLHPGFQATWYSELAKQKIYEGIVKSMTEDMQWIEE